jgi:hypothetical protein
LLFDLQDCKDGRIIALGKGMKWKSTGQLGFY